jgi:hypothetical protein
MEAALGPVQCRLWADSTVMSVLGGRTASEALAAGVPPREVWAAVGDALQLPAKDR